MRNFLFVFLCAIIVSCKNQRTPVSTVEQFVSHLGKGEYTKAYALTHNPSWGVSMETFAADNAFGSISDTRIIYLKLKNSDKVTALVGCKYYAEDEINGSGIFTENFYLALEDNQWKITKLKVLQKLVEKR